MPAETSDASFFFCSSKDDRSNIEIAPVAAQPDADVEAVVLHDGDTGLPLGDDPYPNWKNRRHVWFELGCRHGGSRTILVVSFVSGFILLLGPLEPPPIGFQLWRNALNGYREADDGTM